MNSNHLLPVSFTFWPQQIMHIAIDSAEVPDIVKVTFLDLASGDRSWRDLELVPLYAARITIAFAIWQRISSPSSVSNIVVVG